MSEEPTVSPQEIPSSSREAPVGWVLLSFFLIFYSTDWLLLFTFTLFFMPIGTKENQPERRLPPTSWNRFHFARDYSFSFSFSFI